MNTSDSPDQFKDYYQIFHSLPIPITITTIRDGKFVEVNEAFCQQTGYSREEILGRTALELGLYLHAEQRETILNELNDKGKVFNRELDYQVKSGEIIPSLTSSVTLRFKGRASILSTFMNISEQKRIESTLQSIRTLLDRMQV